MSPPTTFHRALSYNAELRIVKREVQPSVTFLAMVLTIQNRNKQNGHHFNHFKTVKYLYKENFIEIKWPRLPAILNCGF